MRTPAFGAHEPLIGNLAQYLRLASRFVVFGHWLGLYSLDIVCVRASIHTRLHPYTRVTARHPATDQASDSRARKYMVVFI